ncbi:MAG: DeoD-type purine-nucleoside phosphorylase, partial [Halocynthiibacter sp.]
TGMGMPSLSIYVNELIRDYGAKTLIRIGSCGAMQDHVKLRDVVIAMAVTSMTNMNTPVFREVNFAPCADWALLKAATESAASHDVTCHVGNIFSSDVFYSERPDLDAQMERHGVLAVEMEAAELYTLAARYKVRALAVLTVSDHLKTEEALPSEQRENGFGDMVQIALEAAFSG